MEFLRRHLFFIVCGVAGAGGIALGILGINAMSNVAEAMQEAVTLQNQIRAAIRDPENEQTIQAARQRIEKIAGDYQRLLDLADAVDAHDQLIDDFFPRPSYSAKVEFPDKYRQELTRLLQLLNPGKPPDAYEIDEAREQIEAEAVTDDSMFGIDPRERRDADEGALPSPEEVPDRHPSGLITSAAARRSPEVRAAIKKAQSIYCYAGLDSLDVNTYVYDAAGVPPRLIDCWYAQLSLWVQQDVIGALARINNRAAQKLRDEKQHAWVGNLPIKDLISLRVSGYVFPDSEGTAPAPPGGDDPADPPATPTHSFTANACNDEYEVLHFTLKMVVDVRDLPAILAELSKDRFTTAFRVDYVKEPPNLQMVGKIYGPEPVVNVVMDFETCLFSRLYLPIMPDAILDTLNKKRPEPAETG